MAKLKLKWNKTSIQKANRAIYGIVRNIIDTKSRPYDGHKLKVHTGNLRTKIKPLLEVRNNQLVINVKVMEYYKYLDEGTKRIKPWFLTDELLNDSKFISVIKDLTTEATKGAIIDVISSNKP